MYSAVNLYALMLQSVYVLLILFLLFCLERTAWKVLHQYIWFIQ